MGGGQEGETPNPQTVAGLRWRRGGGGALPDSETSEKRWWDPGHAAGWPTAEARDVDPGEEAGRRETGSQWRRGPPPGWHPGPRRGRGDRRRREIPARLGAARTQNAGAGRTSLVPPPAPTPSGRGVALSPRGGACAAPAQHAAPRAGGWAERAPRAGAGERGEGAERAAKPARARLGVEGGGLRAGTATVSGGGGGGGGS